MQSKLIPENRLKKGLSTSTLHHAYPLKRHRRIKAIPYTKMLIASIISIIVKLSNIMKQIWYNIQTHTS